MASANQSRAWFFPTSPRSPTKLLGELSLLKQLDGKSWNKETQLEFSELLKTYPDFEGGISSGDPAFSARDRATRAPRLLGFVKFPERGTRGQLVFTDAGNQFLNASAREQTLIFQRQLSKVQFTSPLHKSGGFEEMSVKPLMIMIKLLLALDSMSKEEIALFAVTLTDHRRFTSTLAEIKKYRKNISNTPVGQRKLFRKTYALQRVESLYENDIEAGNTTLREGGTNFAETKYRTLRDYADSTIRYVRVTGLFTVSPHGQRLTLLSANVADAQFLLSAYGVGLSSFSTLPYERYIDEYLGNASFPAIRKDDSTAQTVDLEKMLKALALQDRSQADTISTKYEKARTKAERVSIISTLEEKMVELQVQSEEKTIRGELSVSLDKVKRTFAEIGNRNSEVIDRPLMYEWNTWRAMVLINDVKAIQGNFVTDPDGNPVTTAGGGKPDILVEYESFWLTVEVTLSSGLRQYESEGEPVSRHLGDLQKQVFERGDKRPVFCLFVAESLVETLFGHFLTLARFQNQRARGALKIVPMRRHVFEKLVEASLLHEGFSQGVLKSLLDSFFSPQALQLGELDWAQHIDTSVDDFHIASSAC